MSAPQTEVLITVAGTETGRFVLTPGDYVIGRNPDCPIRVEADLVSRQHAKLFLNYDHALIEDLGSSNGTQVNGQPIAKDGRTRLWPNQKIQVGTATIELRRLKAEVSNLSLAPSAAMVRRVLPEEFLREKKYDIGKVVAQGGMGAILNAKDATIERTVAMKVMLDTNDADGLARFLNEAKITGQLEHPSIVPVYELSVDENDQPYYTMKFVKGITLKKVLEEIAGERSQESAGRSQAADADSSLTPNSRPLTPSSYPLPALLTIFQKVCDAIAFAHSKGIIHRDLKPENLMLGDYGEVLVMDWGLAKRMKDEGGRMNDGKHGRAASEEPAAQSGHAISSFSPHPSSFASTTLAGTIMGTPQFMSPEQARGEVETLDARSDIYSLGAILYQILSLRVPVTGTDAWEVVGKVGRGEIEPLVERAVPARFETTGRTPGDPAAPDAPKRARSARSTAIPDSLVAVVRKAMSLDREARYATVGQLQRDIESYQTGFATSAEKAGWWKRARLAIKRNKAASIGAAAVLLVGSILGTKAILEGKRAEREATAAKAALANLAKTAPTFAAQARGLVEQGNLEEAFEKIGYAVSLDARNADYRLQRANLLQAMQKLAEAAESYREVLALRTDPAAKLNLELCESLLRDNPGGTGLKRESQEALVDAMIKQGRVAEAAPLSILLGKDSGPALAAIQARLKPLVAVAGAHASVSRLPNGTFRLTFGPLVVELPPLNGLPITEVNLLGTKVSDLTPLKGLRLRWLNINSTPVSDLSPLAGMPLEWLDAGSHGASKISDLTPLKGTILKRLVISGTSVTDLGPLAGMPIEELYISSTVVNDLTPLAGMPLTSLQASNTKITDLSPLRGMPLRFLSLFRTPGVSDLSPLAGLPIEELHLTSSIVTDIGVLPTLPLKRLILECPGVKDLRPLAECKALERLGISKGSTDISFLRALPNLQRLTDEPFGSASTGNIPTAEQFWQKYDAKKAAEKKSP